VSRGVSTEFLTHPTRQGLAPHQLYAPQGTNTARQGLRIDVLELTIVRRDGAWRGTAPSILPALFGE